MIYEYDILLNDKCVSFAVKDSFSYACDEMSSPTLVVQFMNDIFGMEKRADEYIYMLAFNTGMSCIGVFEIAHGTGNACPIDARGVFMRALSVGANSIIMVHNHPSGKTNPSKEDLAVTDRIKKAGDLLGIPLADHIIIGSSGGFTSLGENHLL